MPPLLITFEALVRGSSVSCACPSLPNITSCHAELRASVVCAPQHRVVVRICRPPDVASCSRSTPEAASAWARACSMVSGNLMSSPPSMVAGRGGHLDKGRLTRLDPGSHHHDVDARNCRREAGAGASPTTHRSRMRGRPIVQIACGQPMWRSDSRCAMSITRLS
jgi:hypothetical protein